MDEVPVAHAPVLPGGALAHRGHHDAVGNREIAQMKRCEKRHLNSGIISRAKSSIERITRSCG
jgi:hypothetical protein